MKQTTTNRFIAPFALASLTIAIHACAPKAPSQETVIGALNQLDANSVNVNGVKYSTSGANITIDGQRTTLPNLTPGMVVSMKVTQNRDGVTGKAYSLSYDDELEGVVVSNGVTAGQSTGSMNIMGQTVTVMQDTVFESSVAGVKSIDQITPGMVAEVSGYTDGHGSITATYVSATGADQASYLLRYPSGMDVEGIVTNLDPNAKTFTLGGATVNYAAAAMPDTPLADGQHVVVFTSKELGANETINADKVKKGDEDNDDDDKYDGDIDDDADMDDDIDDDIDDDADKDDDTDDDVDDDTGPDLDDDTDDDIDDDADRDDDTDDDIDDDSDKDDDTDDDIDDDTDDDVDDDNDDDADEDDDVDDDGDIDGKEGDDLEMEGLVTSQVTGGTFSVDGQTVRISGNTKLDGVSENELVVGTKVEVDGKFNRTGDFVADDVEKEQMSDKEIEGKVVSVGKNDDGETGTITVNDVTVMVDRESTMEDDRDENSNTPEKAFRLDKISAGDSVHIDYYVNSNNQNVATCVTRKNSTNGK